jgi:hypothetical protein
MYLNKQGGAYWLQKSDEMRNPYMGKRMLECFDERLAMPVTGDTAAPSTREIEP